MSTMSSRWCLRGACLALASLATGCTTVRPSQRQYLSTPEMNPGTDKLEEMQHSHLESAREAGMGGHGTAGGGCGCG